MLTITNIHSPFITTCSSSTLSNSVMTNSHQDTWFDKKSSIPRGFSNAVEPADPAVRSDNLHNHHLGYGRTLSDQDLSFFDFEPHTPSYQVQNIVSDFDLPRLNVSWNNTDSQLLSPPNSAAFSLQAWPNCEYLRGPPSNVMTDIKPVTSRTNYGQITPTDDECSEKFIPAEPQPPQLISPAPTVNKKRKRALLVTPESTSIASSKRSRKDGNRLVLLGTPQTDFSNQDGNRRSRFLERNRLAASKCRQKKKQWVENLEVKARNFQSQYKHFSLVIDSLKEEILYLKVEMVRHKGCEGSEIQKCIEVDDEAFAEAVERLKREKSTNGCGPSPPCNDTRTDPAQPIGDLESKISSDRRSGSPLPLDDTSLADALLEDDFFRQSQ